MTAIFESPQSTNPGQIEPDLRFGGIRANTTIEVSAEVAEHFNRTAKAAALLPGGWVDFTAGEVIQIPIPAHKLPREEFVRLYQRLTMRVDGQLTVRLADHPRLFSSDPRDPRIVRGTPTFVPTSVFPRDAWGTRHAIELFQDDARILGPVDRLFPSPNPSQGIIGREIADGDGKLMLAMEGNLAMMDDPTAWVPGLAVLFSAPVLGVPTEVAQVDDGGQRTPLTYALLGRDVLGETLLFNEGGIRGIQTAGRSTIRLEVAFPNRGTGFAALIVAGHIRVPAFRLGATVR